MVPALDGEATSSLFVIFDAEGGGGFELQAGLSVAGDRVGGEVVDGLDGGAILGAIPFE